MILSGFAQNKGHFTLTTKVLKKGNKLARQPFVEEYHFMNGSLALRCFDGGKKNTTIWDVGADERYELIEDQGKKLGIKRRNPENHGEYDTVIYSLTNETKVIDGHNCVKYAIENSVITGFMWVTHDFNCDFTGCLKDLADKIRLHAGDVVLENELKGFPIQIFQKQKIGGHVFECSFSDIEFGRCNEGLFSTAGYDITDVSQYKR